MFRSVRRILFSDLTGVPFFRAGSNRQSFAVNSHHF